MASENRFELTSYAVYFSHPLKTGAGNITGTAGLLLKLYLGPYLGIATTPPMEKSTILKAETLMKKWLTDRIKKVSGTSILQQAHATLPLPELSTLVEVTVRDIMGRAGKVPFGSTLRGAHKSARHLPVMGLLNPSLPIEEETRLALQNGYQALKLKVGSPPARKMGEELGEDMGDKDFGLAVDLANIAKIRELSNEIPLVLDANGAYPMEACMQILTEFSAYNIAYIEEPVAGLENLLEVAKSSPIPIAADESCRTWENLHIVGSAPEIPVVVVKPTYFPDLQELCNRVQSFQKIGKQVIISSAIDGAIGLAAAAQLASVLPNAEYNFTGLDTSKLIMKDLALPYPIINGFMSLPEEAGLGITL